MKNIVLVLAVILLGVINIAIVFFLFAFIFSPKSFVKYFLYCKKMGNFYDALIRQGCNNMEALEKISKFRHPELSDSVHKKLVSKFSDIGKLIHFIYWGIEVTLMSKSERTDKNALAVVEAGDVVLTGKDYKVTVDRDKVKNILRDQGKGINIGGCNLEKKEEKAKGLVYILLNIMKGTAEGIMQEETFSSLPQEKIDDICIEFVFFYLHQFNRTFFAWLGRSERDELMDAVLEELVKYWKKVAAEEKKTAYDNLSADCFEHYVGASSFQHWVKDFYAVYSEREIEYAQYRDNPEEGKGLAGTLLWEFGNKIAKMAGKEKDLEIIMLAQLAGEGFTHFADALKELIETGKIGDTEFKLDCEK